VHEVGVYGLAQLMTYLFWPLLGLGMACVFQKRCRALSRAPNEPVVECYSSIKIVLSVEHLFTAFFYSLSLLFLECLGNYLLMISRY